MVNAWLKITKAFSTFKKTLLSKGMNKRERKRKRENIIYVQNSLNDSSHHKLSAFFYNI